MPGGPLQKCTLINGLAPTVDAGWVQLMERAYELTIPRCACRPGMGGSAVQSACMQRQSRPGRQLAECGIARDGDALLCGGADELDKLCQSAYQPAATVFRYLNCFEPWLELEVC